MGLLLACNFSNQPRMALDCPNAYTCTTDECIQSFHDNYGKRQLQDSPFITFLTFNHLQLGLDCMLQ
jgi:hypothetical protein